MEPAARQTDQAQGWRPDNGLYPWARLCENLNQRHCLSMDATVKVADNWLNKNKAQRDIPYLERIVQHAQKLLDKFYI